MTFVVLNIYTYYNLDTAWLHSEMIAFEHSTKDFIMRKNVHRLKPRPHTREGFFLRIIEQLSNGYDSGRSLHDILKELCDHFAFGCGFVYEMDYGHRLHLKESFSHGRQNLVPVIELYSHFPLQEVENLINLSTYCSTLWEGQDVTKVKMSQLFDAESLLLTPVVGNDNQLIGLVGIANSSHEILLNYNEAYIAKRILHLISNQVKLRHYQRNLEHTQKSINNIMDGTGLGISINDFYSSEILYVNKAAALLYGAEKNVLGKKC